MDFLGRKIVFLYTDVLKNIQIIKSEVIVILRRVFPPPPKWRTVQGPEGSLFKVSLTVVSFAPSFLVVLFLFLPSQFYLKWGASRARASPQSASAMLPFEATPPSDGGRLFTT